LIIDRGGASVVGSCKCLDGFGGHHCETSKNNCCFVTHWKLKHNIKTKYFLNYSEPTLFHNKTSCIFVKQNAPNDKFI
jgi:hypothetical protein